MVGGYASEVLRGQDETRARAVVAMLWSSLMYILLWMPLWTIMYNIYDASIERNTGIYYNQTSGLVDQCLPLKKPENPPITVIFIIAWLFASFAVFPLIHTYRLVAKSNPVNAARSEVFYSIASFFSKLPLLAVIAAGLVARRDTVFPERGSPQPSDDSVPSNDTVFVGIGIGIGVSFMLAIVMGGWFYKYGVALPVQGSTTAFFGF